MSSVYICWYKGQGHLPKSRSNMKVTLFNGCYGGVTVAQTQLIFSSPEHEVLRVNYCDRAVSLVRRPPWVVRRASCIVNFLPCVRSRGHIFSPIIMKLGQNVCLDEFENGSCRVKN